MGHTPGRKGDSSLHKLRARLHLDGAGLEEGTCVDTRTAVDNWLFYSPPLCPRQVPPFPALVFSSVNWV